jgi:hypothetical protein
VGSKVEAIRTTKPARSRFLADRGSENKAEESI